MPEFILLLHEPPSTGDDLSPEEIQAVIREYMEWSQGVAARGKLRGGEKLADDGGRLLSRQGDGVQVTDGPYAEAKEVIGGYFLIEAADWDEAVEIARSCPHVSRGRIELRRIEPTQGS